VIKSWGDGATRRFYETGKSKFSGLDLAAAEELLAALDEVVSLTELSPLKSVGLHKLKGDRRGMWAMTINGPWRLCFRFQDGDAYDVTIIDYH
jgi:proteic killer suppression protein